MSPLDWTVVFPPDYMKPIQDILLQYGAVSVRGMFDMSQGDYDYGDDYSGDYSGDYEYDEE